MARPARIEFPGAIYHVMSRGVNGCATYLDDRDRKRFLSELQILADARRLIPITFCLMTNHFHLLVETPVGLLSRWMKQVLGKYSQDFNRCHQRTGHLWQARYKGILVEDGDYLLSCSRYIHRNPLRAGIVQSARDYGWSSYQEYLGTGSRIVRISPDRILNAIGGRGAYERYVESDTGKDLEDPFQQAYRGIAFGSPDFIKRMLALIQPPPWSDDFTGVRAMKQVPALSVEMVGRVVDDQATELSACRRNRILMWALRRFTLLKCREIAALCHTSPSAVTRAWNAVELRRRESSPIQRTLIRIERQLADSDRVLP